MSQVFSPFKNNPNESGNAVPSSDDTQDSVFAQRANSAWGIAFVATEAVSTATDAVADGFAELFQELENETSPQDTHFEILRLTRNAAIRLLETGTGGRHSREPVSILGETKDRQATLALTALTEPARSVLWLIEAERLSVEQTTRIIGSTATETSSVIREARTDFRRYYVDATRRDGLNAGCVETLDLLAAYGSESITDTDRAAVDSHLAVCDSCRNIVAKLGDLESRLQAAIPAIPAWTRQYVMDTWDAISTSGNLIAIHADATQPTSNLLVRKVATAVAGVAIVAATAIGLTYPAKDADKQHETTSSQLAAPTNAGTSNAATAETDEPSVATPDFRADAKTVAPTTTAASAMTVVETSDNQSAATKTAKTSPTSAPTTTAPTTTTTQPVNEDVLVDLPPIAASTTTTTAQQQSDRD